MFEKFTDSARRVVVLAQQEAWTLGHDRIGASHLLLGMVHDDAGPASVVLRSFGLTLADVRSAVSAAIGLSEAEQRTHIPFTARAKRVLERSVGEAEALHHSYVSSGHLLLALMAEDEGVAIGILTSVGIGREGAQSRVLAAIAAAPEAPPPEVNPEDRAVMAAATARANVRAREIAAELKEVRAAKAAALDAGDLAGATAMSERENALLAARIKLAADLQSDRRTPPPPASPE